MTTDDALWIMAIGFFLLAIFWLYGLIFLMIKKYIRKKPEMDGESTKIDDKNEMQIEKVE